jgi:hypothetical protein
LDFLTISAQLVMEYRRCARFFLRFNDERIGTSTGPELTTGALYRPIPREAEAWP